MWQPGWEGNLGENGCMRGWVSTLFTWNYHSIGYQLYPNTLRLILSLCLFNLHAEYIMQNTRLDEAQDGVKIAGRNINNQIHRWQKVRGTKEPLDESERGEWKSWLKNSTFKNEDHGIWSHHFMANRWRNSDRLYFLGVQNHYRWWLQPWN